MSADTVAAVLEAFQWMEHRDLRVGRIWLNPQEVQELWKHPEVFDRGVHPEVMKHYLETVGATLMGYMLGAKVFQTKLVPLKHIAMVPVDIEAQLINSTGCMPLVYP